MNEQLNPKRLEWQCRRGMLELDVILIPFLKMHFGGLTEQQQCSFVELLSFPDPDIYTWIMGFGLCGEESLIGIIEEIRLKMKVA